MKKLWDLWIEFTRKRAEKLAWSDVMMFGTGFTIRRWWGHQHLSPFSVFTHVKTQPPSGERFFGMEMKPDTRLDINKFVINSERPWFNLGESVQEERELYRKFVTGEFKEVK